MIRLHQQGFTIAELMIATGIFSLILLLCSTAVITIGRQFHKTSVSITTQESARTIMEEVSRQVQLGSSAPLAGAMRNYGSGSVDVNVFCIGAVRFSYVVGWQVGDALDAAQHKTPHAVWRDSIPNESVCVAPDMTTSNPSDANNSGTADQTEDGFNGKELLPKQLRLRSTILPSLVTGSTRLWKVGVSVAFGDDDTLNFTTPGDETTITNCRGINFGSVFCATSELNTNVYRRFN